MGPPSLSCRFLAGTGGGSAPTATRKTQNFHSHFAQLHAAEAAARDRAVKEARARTAVGQKAAADYVAPTSKRRDELRWQTRVRLQDGTGY